MTRSVGYAACLLTGLFVSLLLYSEVFVLAPGDNGYYGDFQAHAGYVDVHYSYIYALRQGIEALTGWSNLTALFAIIYLSVAGYLVFSFALFWREQRDIALAGLMLLVVATFMPVYNLLDRDIYLGQISPNVYHNSTFLVSLFPNLLLFVFAVRAVQQPISAQSVLLIALLSALSIGAKPSFFVILAPSLVLYAAFSGIDMLRRAVLLGLLPLLLFALHYAFLMPHDLETEIDPGGVWSLFTSSIAYSIATSVVFFAAVLAIYRHEALRRPEMVVALLCLGFGIMQFYLLAEVGPRRVHGNFSWAMHQAISILLVATLAFIASRPVDRRTWLALFFALPHMASGLLYLGKNHIAALT